VSSSPFPGQYNNGFCKPGELQWTQKPQAEQQRAVVQTTTEAEDELNTEFFSFNYFFLMKKKIYL